MANNERLKSLQAYLKKRNISSAVLSSLLSPDDSLEYFSGFGKEAILFIGKKPVLCHFKLDEKSRVMVKRRSFARFKELAGFVKKKLAGSEKIGINARAMTVKELSWLKRQRRARYLDISKYIFELVAVKSDDEISKIRKACRITSRIFKQCMSRFGQFRTEGQVKRFLLDLTEKYRCTPAFPPIVASGGSASIPHYSKEAKLKKGFCVIDYGVKYQGYSSDMTRTIYLGIPAAEEKKLYEELLAVQNKMIGLVKPGIKALWLEEEARKEMKSRKKLLLHGLSHSLGLAVHEAMPKKLSKGVVMAIEPGFYKQDRFGIRIEDTVLVTAGGAKRLTACSSKLRII